MILRGLTTVSYFADDVAAARDWYSELFGTEPYFVRPEEGEPLYVEFRIGDYLHEFGIVNSRFAPHPVPPRPAGAVVHWAVDDIDDAYRRLLAKGATEHEPPEHLEAGYVKASVVDPFGNVLGLFYNPHYLAVLDSFRSTGSIDRYLSESDPTRQQ